MNQASILIVDDELPVCRIVQRILTIEKYQVQISSSVVNALEAIDQQLFDGYVLDVKLRDGSGLDVAVRIRSKGSEAAIILLSGYDTSTILLRAKALGIFEIVEKPFSREMIVRALKKAMGSPKMASASFAT